MPDFHGAEVHHLVYSVLLPAAPNLAHGADLVGQADEFGQDQNPCSFWVETDILWQELRTVPEDDVLLEAGLFYRVADIAQAGQGVGIEDLVRARARQLAD